MRNSAYTEADFRGEVAIVLGSEAAGLTAAWQTADVTAISLPMHGAADSLNVSAAAAALFYEALRQRAAQRIDSESLAIVRSAVNAAAGPLRAC